MLLLSAFFSGMEIAFLSKNRLKLEIDRKQSRGFDFVANVFARHPGQYITTILVGNNIALVIYSLYMSKMLRHLIAEIGWSGVLSDFSLLIETLISTVIIIFFAEFVPKSIFKNNPNFYFKFFAPLIYLFYLLLYPIARFTTTLSQLLLRVVGGDLDAPDESRAFDKQDLASLLDGGADSSSETDNEIKLFQNALDFADLRVRDCMTPRVDIEAVDIADTSISEITARFAKTKFSRIFLWQGSIDNIVGYVNSKSLFNEPKHLSEALRSVNFVSETMPLNALMQSLIKHKSNIAVVIDEFGGTAGVISLEDVLEQIFGEIEDEHDETEMIERQIGDGEYHFSGRLEVRHLREKYELKIEECDEYDTLAGYIIYHHKEIPEAGESINIGGLEFNILRMNRSRIELVGVKI